MDIVEFVASSALILSLLLLKVISLQKQLNEMKLTMDWSNNRADSSASPKSSLSSSPSSPNMNHAGSLSNIDERLRMLTASGKRMQAIKEFRKASGVGLKEAKEYVDHLERADR
ncbi:large subunit ribosomal protein L7/L12 [Paenibacillus endophyticus]|uniref:Large subunit ribosomal protein L7/L12 n=1 Tax=Paenibacillus endophyticus TaxID=1294268 RepID=A0A7W5C5K0_9BACL|nr:ribosomal protein L7/L12 [Paenibacillus endophyticus]MBB3151453.1 large subunit ribosomal protein L7/L12 [Paenibacillus endophyticus]